MDICVWKLDLVDLGDDGGLDLFDIAAVRLGVVRQGEIHLLFDTDVDGVEEGRVKARVGYFKREIMSNMAGGTPSSLMMPDGAGRNSASRMRRLSSVPRPFPSWRSER